MNVILTVEKWLFKYLKRRYWRNFENFCELHFAQYYLNFLCSSNLNNVKSIIKLLIALTDENALLFFGHVQFIVYTV